MKAASTRPDYCLNCGEKLTKESVFCHHCGQKAEFVKPTIKHFVDETLASLFSIDSKTISSLVPILLQPGEITKAYFEGKRTRFISPIKFYLTISVLYFILAGINRRITEFKQLDKIGLKETSKLTASIDTLMQVEQKVKDSIPITDTLPVKKEKPKTKKKKSKKDDTEISINPREGGAIMKMVTSLQSNMKKDLEKQKLLHEQQGENYDSLMLTSNTFEKWKYFEQQKIVNVDAKVLIDYFKSKFPLVLFCFLPIFAISLLLVLRRTEKYYLEHLVFTFHAQTFFFILLTLDQLLALFFQFLPNVNYKGSEGLIFLIFLIYLWKALSKVYPASRRIRISRFVAVNLVYFTMAGFFAVVAAFLLFISF